MTFIYLYFHGTCFITSIVAYLYVINIFLLLFHLQHIKYRSKGYEEKKKTFELYSIKRKIQQKAHLFVVKFI